METSVKPKIIGYNKEGELLNLISKYIQLKHVTPPSVDIQSEFNEINEDFLEKYGLLVEEQKPYLINSFSKIGWADPFPNESLMMSDEEDRELFNQVKENPLKTFIYSKERTLTKESPSMVYLPNKVVMFKIMRACIDVTDKSKLWYNCGNHGGH